MSTDTDRKEGFSNIWLKAAIAGGLWASVEIIIGSFLHNLKIPFAGSILASFGIILMVAFSQLWPERGLIIRVGVICALMKSVSPSAVILGPMAGIMAEAILMEISIIMLGRNFAGFLLGGALALFSALLHKIFSLLILYGTNIIKIYLNLFHFASKQINIPDADPVVLITYLAVIYLGLGAIAALIGFIVGNQAKKGISQDRNFTTELSSDRNFFQTNPLQKFRIGLLFSHVILIPGGLLLFSKLQPFIYVPFVGAYLSFCLFYYKGITRRLKKPFFWIQLLLIVLLAFLFWNYLSDKSGEDKFEGLWIGLEMALRAIYIVIAFSALSIELRNPIMKNFIFQLGFTQLYLALNLSFSALPAMISNLSPSGKTIRNPFFFFPLLLQQAESWYSSLKEQDSNLET